jgi:hypothetical protein
MSETPGQSVRDTVAQCFCSSRLWQPRPRRRLPRQFSHLPQ